MRTNEVLRDHADSESVCECGVDRNSAEFVGNKQIHSLTHSLTDTQLYILVEMVLKHNCYSLITPQQTQRDLYYICCAVMWLQ